MDQTNQEYSNIVMRWMVKRRFVCAVLGWALLLDWTISKREMDRRAKTQHYHNGMRGKTKVFCGGLFFA